MKNSIYTLLMAGILFSCDETVTIDPNQSEPRIIIEGLVTDHNKNHYVRITQTVNFYAQGGSQPITDAIVKVSDDEGNSYDYMHNPSGSEDSTGYYFSVAPFAGLAGHNYSLQVDIGSDTYTAEDKLYPVTAIDSLKATIDEDEADDPEDPGYIYEVLFYAKEPQETKDFYLFKFYRNDSLIRDDETDIYFSDDDVLAEKINGIPTAGYYKIGDVGKVEMYSISRQGFVFYNDLINLLNSDGGMFGSPPVNPRNNLSGGAMGYFQASSMVSATIMVE